MTFCSVPLYSRLRPSPPSVLALQPSFRLQVLQIRFKVTRCETHHPPFLSQEKTRLACNYILHVIPACCYCSLFSLKKKPQTVLADYIIVQNHASAFPYARKSLTNLSLQEGQISSSILHLLGIRFEFFLLISNLDIIS